MQTICCVCKRIQRGQAWLECSDRRCGILSHGFCPQCFAVEMTRLAAFVAGRGGEDAETAAAVRSRPA